MIDIAAGIVALVILLHRSRSLPSLRPAAAAVAAFACLDAGRLAWSPWAAAGVWPWSWADVIVHVAMPGLWMGLLVLPSSDERQRLGDRSACADAPESAGHARQDPAPCLPDGSPGAQSDRAHVAAHARGLAPLLAGLLYAAAALAARHWPPVREHWQGWLQAPRLAGLAMALWVVLRSAAERVAQADPPEPQLPPRGRLGCVGHRSGTANEGARNEEKRREGQDDEGLHEGQGAPDASAAQGRSPSTTIGLILAGSAGVLVVVGAWGDWAGVVRPGAALAWIAVAIVAVMARE